MLYLTVLKILYLLCEVLFIAHSVVGEQSILDSFVVTEGTHCPSGTVLGHGKSREQADDCALMCLMTKDCTHFQWNYPDNPTVPCYLKDACEFAAHSTGDTYTQANDINWVTVPGITAMPGMTAFNENSYGNFEYGKMKDIAEEVCVLHGLLSDFVSVTWSKSSRNCAFKTQGGGNNLNPNSLINTHIKAVIAGCVPHHSCYALLTHQNGQTKATADTYCRTAGGHLAESASQEELAAVNADGRFAVLGAPLWLGIQFTSGQWQSEEPGSVLTALPWLAGQPASTTEGTPVIIDPLSSWGVATATDGDTAFPFCEFPAITMTTTGDRMNHLNDGDLTTCFTPQTSSEAVGTTFKTAHLNPASPSQILVKVHGDGIVCAQNVHVWQMVAGNTDSGDTYLSACQLTGSYIWQQMQAVSVQLWL